MGEVERSAQILGCARVVHLGYGRFRLAGGAEMVAAPGTFAAVPIEESAARLAQILREERADLLTVYDRFGGYGHVDHIRGARRRPGRRRLAEPGSRSTTLDRTYISRAGRILNGLQHVPSRVCRA